MRNIICEFKEVSSGFRRRRKVLEVNNTRQIRNMLNSLEGVSYYMTQFTVDPSRIIVKKQRIAPMDRLNRALDQTAVLTDPSMSEAAFLALACLGLYNQ